MSLKRALNNYQLYFSFPLHMPLAFKLARAEENIEAHFASLSGPREPIHQDLAASQRLVMGHFRLHGTLEGIPKRHLRRVPWYLFEADPEDGASAPLSEDPAFCQAWCGWFESHATTSALLALIHNVLLHYPAAEQLAFWRYHIESRLAQTKRPQLLVWRQRCVRFKLLDATAGPMEFAQRLYRVEHSLHDLCEQFGVTGNLAGGGFVIRGMEQLLELLGHYADPGSGMDLTRLQSFLNGLRDDQGKLQRVVAGFSTKLAEVLLLPFRRREADPKWRNLLRDFLIEYLGNPRINPAAWRAVHADARAVMLTWLAGRPTQLDDQLHLFLAEASKQLPELEVALFNLKANGAATNTGVISRSCQRLHSIKGVADLLSLNEIAKVSLAMETTLARIRDKALTPTTAVINKLLSDHNDLREKISDIANVTIYEPHPF
ncbi:MAG: Hpt domain-containing protein [Magnetococcales bacterium]|nr:Hpt domain-containing protein [Magnetococcales bacterium]